MEVPNLQDWQQRQMPYVISRTNNQLAADIAFYTRKQIPTRFRTRDNWLVHGMQYKRGTKRDTTAYVLHRDHFMGKQEGGQDVKPVQGKSLSIPTQWATKLFGKNQVPSPKELLTRTSSALLDHKKFFRNSEGVWRRHGRKHVRGYYLHFNQAHHDDELQLQQDADLVAKKNANRYFKNYLQEALATKNATRF